MHTNARRPSYIFYRWSALLSLVVLAAACQPTEEPTDSALSATVSPERWQCRNDLEISCDVEHCEAADSFTPMDVRFDDAGSMSVCAYSGCWEGTGTVVQSEHFVVLTGHELPFSTAPDSADSRAAIVIALDRADQVGILKAGAFVQPLLCEQLPGLP